MASQGGIWHLEAFMRLEVKNAHVTLQGILKKINEMEFSVGCMVSSIDAKQFILRHQLFFIKYTWESQG